MAGRFLNLELNEECLERETEVSLRAGTGFDADDYLARAVDALRNNQFENALRMYTRCLERNRAVIPAWVGQVQMLVQLGECREARLWADKALELFRDNGELLAAKAQACARLNDRRASFACSDGALQAPGCSPWRWQARGEVLLAADQPYFDECFRNSLSETAADWFDHVIVARIYLYYGRATNALTYVKSALQAEAGAAAAWFEMGNCQVALGLTGSGRTSYERCLELHPESVAALEALGTLDSLSFFDWLKGRIRWRRRR